MCRVDCVEIRRDRSRRYWIGDEVEVNGLPATIVSIDDNSVEPFVHIGANYGRVVDGMFRGLSCKELATVPGNELNKGHEWTNATSIHNDNYMEYCRYCGAFRDTGRRISAEDRSRGRLELDMALSGLSMLDEAEN